MRVVAGVRVSIIFATGLQKGSAYARVFSTHGVCQHELRGLEAEE
jgi:hypothetical protein